MQPTSRFFHGDRLTAGPLQNLDSSSTPSLDPSLVRGVALATFLFARVNNFSAWLDVLKSDDAIGFVADVRRVLSQPISQLAGEIAQRRPDSILAVFSNQAEDLRPNHAQRGLHAALLIVYELVQLVKGLSLGRTALTAPLPVVTIGVHLGLGELAWRANGPSRKVFASGESVETARELAAAAKDLQWSIATSVGTHVASAGRMQGARTRRVPLVCSSGMVDIVEVTGLIVRNGSQTPASVVDALRMSVAENQARATRGMDQKLPVAM